jgi:hypothetical protein
LKSPRCGRKHGKSHLDLAEELAARSNQKSDYAKTRRH